MGPRNLVPPIAAETTGKVRGRTGCRSARSAVCHLVAAQQGLDTAVQVRMGVGLDSGAVADGVDEADLAAGQEHVVVAAAVTGHGKPALVRPLGEELEAGGDVEGRAI
jgi:hypothetical protein